MVRLVFRPYTQLRRSICTSESLRSSIRVSPDFNLARHSSPSFGSQRVSSCYSPRNEVDGKCRGCGRLRHRPWATNAAFAFTAPLGLVNPMTRLHVRLLGPCFKTGRRRRRPTRNWDGNRKRNLLAIRVSLATRRRRSQKIRASPQGQNFTRNLGPTTAVRCVNCRRNAATNASHSHQKPLRVLETRAPTKLTGTFNSDFENASVYHYTVSRTIELSLQSSFQLSLTVLVRYRSRGHI